MVSVWERPRCGCSVVWLRERVPSLVCERERLPSLVCERERLPSKEATLEPEAVRERTRRVMLAEGTGGGGGKGSGEEGKVVVSS